MGIITKDFKALRVCQTLKALLSDIEKLCERQYARLSPFSVQKVACENLRQALIYQHKFDAEGFELHEGLRVKGGKRLEVLLNERFSDVASLERLFTCRERQPYDYVIVRKYAMRIFIKQNKIKLEGYWDAKDKDQFIDCALRDILRRHEIARARIEKLTTEGRHLGSYLSAWRLGNSLERLMKILPLSHIFDSQARFLFVEKEKERWRSAANRRKDRLMKNP